MEFVYVQKRDIPTLLPAMFDLLYENMSRIIPDERNREAQREEWYGQVGPALMGEKRRLVLLRQGGTMAGFFWYYLKGSTLMMEEIQLRKEYQGTGLFRRFFAWLMEGLPEDIDQAEAFAHRDNRKSRRILEYLGLRAVTVAAEEEYILYRGDCSLMRDRINQKKEENCDG